MPLFSSLLYADWGLFLLRLAVGVVFVIHGWPKINNAKAMASSMGWSANAIKALGVVEFVSGLALILGVYTQLAALLLAIVMVAAWYHKTMKWHMPFTAMDKTGWEFDMVLLAANLAIFLSGGGTMVMY
ncbi:DoxX family protein [Candidatus Uhrbacteria bacterium]|nr:DoxX family protein [Candidatus Uhrbacteria bacterium]